MKTLLHPDYWVEIPAGEFLTGLSQAQRDLIGQQIRAQVGYDRFPSAQQELVESAVVKFCLAAKRAEGKSLRPPVDLSEEEERIQRGPLGKIIDVEYRLTRIPEQKVEWLDRFYIARFELTQYQYGLFQGGTPVRDLPGALEGPAKRALTPDSLEERQLFQTAFGRDHREVSTRTIARVEGREIELQRELGARIPTTLEWEKAARGTEGQLYPWGNDWNPEAGHFSEDQDNPGWNEIDRFPLGVSPYGVWGMAGGLPEFAVREGLTPYTTRKGCHFKESSGGMAWFDHLVVQPGKGQWVSLRLVLDEWPVQQWQGHRVEEPPPPEPEPLMNQFEWLALKLELGPELEPIIASIEAEQKAEAEHLLKTLLKENAQNVPAWLLLATVLAEVTQQRDCIERALRLKPDHWLARKMQVRLAKPEDSSPTETDKTG